MAEVKCDECKGKGHTTQLIGSDVHIVECKECLGWGSITVTSKPRRGKFTGGRFGQIDDIDLVKLDKKSAYPTTINIDALLAE